MDVKCLKCRFVSGLGSNTPFCSYIIKTGTPRGCKADENCDKFQPMKKGVEEK